jgi:hypothetical protein
MTQSLLRPSKTSCVPLDAVDHEAPYLVEKLLKDRVVDTAEQAEVLFTEVKRYLVLNQIDRTKSWQMYSLHVDEVWHQFVLFTVEYVAFCHRYFGHYVHHAPSNAPDPGPEFGERPPTATFEEFAQRYREIFGAPLPDVWHDSTCVTPHRRVLNDRAGQLDLSTADGMIDVVAPSGRVLFSVNDIAFEAMHFVVSTGAFYVRELPGALTDDEKVALIANLVDMKLLRVG